MSDFDFEGIEAMSFTHTMKGPQFSDELHPFELHRGHEASVTLTVEDPETYQRLLAESDAEAFTIANEFDLNPHHSHPQGFRARVRRLGAIVRWHWRKLIRRPLPESMRVILYDVRPENITIEGAS